MDINNLNYFDIESLTSQEDLKRVYRKQSKILHPDSGGDVEQFKKLTEEYDYITNQKLYLEEVRKEAFERAKQSVKTNVFNQQTAHNQSFYNNTSFNRAPEQRTFTVENYDTFADFYKKYHNHIMRDKDSYLFSSSKGQWNKMNFRKRDDGSYYFRNGDKEYVLKRLKEEQETKKPQEESVKEAKKKAKDTVKTKPKEKSKTEPIDAKPKPEPSKPNTPKPSDTPKPPDVPSPKNSGSKLIPKKLSDSFKNMSTKSKVGIGIAIGAAIIGGAAALSKGDSKDSPKEEKSGAVSRDESVNRKAKTKKEKRKEKKEDKKSKKLENKKGKFKKLDDTSAHFVQNNDMRVAQNISTFSTGHSTCTLK